MTNYFARRRRSKGAWLDGILADHAKATGQSVEDLAQNARVAIDNPTSGAVVVADMPAPARAYAVMLAEQGFAPVATLHVLEGQPEAAARALFSQMSVHARTISGQSRVIVTPEGLSENSRDLIERLGAPYGVGLAEGEQVDGDGEPDEGISEFVEEGEDEEPVEDEDITLPEPEPAQEDLDVQDEEPEEDPDALICDDCGKTFKNQAGLASHARVHA